MPRGKNDVKGRKRLTKQQLQFMKELQAAIEELDGPVSVMQIRIKIQRSESLVRGRIKLLLKAGYVRCINRTKQKRYVPSALWLEELDEEIDCTWIGGRCEQAGCDSEAESYWNGRYLCRNCLIGLDAVGDKKDIRKWHESVSGPKSIGALWEETAPNLSEE